MGFKSSSRSPRERDFQGQGEGRQGAMMIRCFKSVYSIARWAGAQRQICQSSLRARDCKQLWPIISLIKAKADGLHLSIGYVSLDEYDYTDDILWKKFFETSLDVLHSICPLSSTLHDNVQITSLLSHANVLSLWSVSFYYVQGSLCYIFGWAI